MESDYTPGWAGADEIPTICMRNHEFTSNAKMGQFAAVAWPPIGWTSHEDCEMCSVNEKWLKWVPPVKRHPLAADTSTAYAFTLTMPPDYVPKKPLEEIARKIMEHGQTAPSKGCKAEFPSEWAFVLEHTEKGTPHIHGVYKTPSGKRILRKYFQRYWPLWDEDKKMGHGHQGGYHAKARHEQSYANYLTKEGVVTFSPSLKEKVTE